MTSDHHIWLRETFLKRYRQHSNTTTLCKHLAVQQFLRLGRQEYAPQVHRILPSGPHDLLVPVNHKELTLITHSTCVLDDVVYDPLHNTPIPIHEYGITVFGASVRHELLLGKPHRE